MKNMDYDGYRDRSDESICRHSKYKKTNATYN